MKAGFIGTGSMGLPLASNILKQEKALVAYDINREATKSLADRQARIVESPVDVANESDIVFACMPTIQSFHAVVTAQNGLIHGSQMKLFVNLGTMGTDSLAEIEDVLSQSGIGTLDSPVTGGAQRAWEGDITVISSGPKTVFDQAVPFLKSFARDIHYVGEKVGQAQLTKVCNNIMSFANLIVGLEALTMAAKGGVDPEKVLAVINSGSGQNSASLTKIPNFVMNRGFNMAAPMQVAAKDIMLWRMEAEKLDVPQNVGNAAYHTMQQALAMGLRDGDLSEMVKVVERAAGFELPKTRN